MKELREEDDEDAEEGLIAALKEELKKTKSSKNIFSKVEGDNGCRGR